MNQSSMPHTTTTRQGSQAKKLEEIKYANNVAIAAKREAVPITKLEAAEKNVATAEARQGQWRKKQLNHKQEKPRLGAAHARRSPAHHHALPCHLRPSPERVHPFRLPPIQDTVRWGRGRSGGRRGGQSRPGLREGSCGGDQWDLGRGWEAAAVEVKGWRVDDRYLKV
jgi:hypothetical protein